MKEFMSSENPFGLRTVGGFCVGINFKILSYSSSSWNIRTRLERQNTYMNLISRSVKRRLRRNETYLSLHPCVRRNGVGQLDNCDTKGPYINSIVVAYSRNILCTGQTHRSSHITYIFYRKVYIEITKEAYPSQA